MQGALGKHELWSMPRLQVLSGNPHGVRPDIIEMCREAFLREQLEMIRIDHIDHFVLTVASIEATCAFYMRVLGMEVQTFGAGRKGLRFGDQKINLHQAGREFEPKAKTPVPGSADYCLISTTPLDEVIAHLAREGIPVELGPVDRTGATGPLRSVYFRDPDANLVEIANLATS